MINTDIIDLGFNTDPTNDFFINTDGAGGLVISRKNSNGSMGAQVFKIGPDDSLFQGTAPVVESGSNVDGSWVKWADGTMICSFTVGATLPITTALAGGFRSQGQTVNYPQPFLTGTVPFVTGLALEISAFGVGATPNNPNTVSVFFTAVTSQATSAARVGQFTAVGRWK